LRLKLFFILIIFSIFCAPVFSQTHTSVPLDNQIYRILEQAQLRNLCSPLPGVRPYTQSVAASAIKEILDSDNSEKLASTEREILEYYLKKFSKPNPGFDIKRGAYYGETFVGSKDTILSLNVGAGADIEGSAGLYSYTSNKERHFGTETWFNVYLNGDITEYASYNFFIKAGLVQTPRKYLGEYDSFYKGFVYDVDGVDPDDAEYQNITIDAYSEPLTHFPYTYRKQWDSSVFFFKSLSSLDYWPNSIAGGYGIFSEITASFLENRLFVRAGRLTHEWGSAPLGSSLSFNQAARPFFGVETEFSPFSWFTIASITGALEYLNKEDIVVSAATFQNLFSATMLQFKYKNYLFFDITDNVVYPKRFEPGYISPITNSFFYQNNIGDYDNLSLSFNLMGQVPNIGNIWVSFFMDEMNFLSNLRDLDRQMFAIQAGTTFYLPFLAFSSIKLSYTKVNPYCYTKNRNFTPWYGNNRMEAAYVNNGVSLGYYLPPNSDEILVRFDTMPLVNLSTNLQYQLIRHGADFGSSAVDGSNLSSTLDPIGRDDKDVLKRHFLRDGAYQWLHIIKIGGEWSLEKSSSALPFAFYWEIGTVISYFTNTEEPANNGSKNSYSKINTPEYPKSSGFIAKLGIRLFPKN